MAIALLKKINEVIPYWVKKPFSKIIRNKLIKNKEFLNTYSELTVYDLMSEEEKNKLQFELLKQTLKHAYDHTKYYHELFDKVEIKIEDINSIADLKRIPILTKDLLKERWDDLQADDIDDFYLVTTGGTSGEPIKVNMEKKAIYREWAFVYHYWSKFGYDFKTTKLATFRGINLGNKLYEINPLYAEVRLNVFALNENNFGQYIEIIDRFGADIIYGYPSAIYNFCRIANKKGINLKERFKMVLLISENLYTFQEEMIKQVMNCEIAMFYGHSERAVFGEKYGKTYLFNSLYGIIEIGKKNEPIVTGFINRKTPLIRYLIDDQVIPTGTGYEVVGHHSSEVLVGSNDERVTMASINFHDDTFKKIKAYQFVQKDIGRCILRLESEKKLSSVDMYNIKNNVERKLGKGFTCFPEQVDTVEISKRGKYKMLISEINISENEGRN